MKVIELQKSLLNTWKFLTLFPKILTTDDKYSPISRDKWMQKIHMHLCQKQNLSSEFFSVFFESSLNFKDFKKKITLIAYVFAKLPTKKGVLR